MNIQRRVYKLSEQREEIRAHIDNIEMDTNLTSRWPDEDHFIVKKKSPFSIFRLCGDTSELKQNHKLIVFITADFRYLFLFVLPFGLLLYSFQRAHSMIFALAGISMTVFILMISSANIYNLKKKFKETIRIM